MCSKILLDCDLKDLYLRKKESCKSRMIPFELSEEDYRMLYKSRQQLGKCAYTNMHFTLTHGTGHLNYPELDRIDPLKPYSRDNVVFTTKEVHSFKTRFIEQKQSLKGQSNRCISFVHRINKILACEDNVREILKPYKDLYVKVDERHKRSEKHSERMKELEEQRVKLDKEAAEKAAQGALKAKYKAQQELASYYNKKFKEFDSMGVVMQISIKEMRDLLRISRCKISKTPFDSIWDKHLWVINKALPVTKDNVIITQKNVAESLDYLSKGDNMVLKTSMLNVLKVI